MILTPEAINLSQGVGRQFEKQNVREGVQIAQFFCFICYVPQPKYWANDTNTQISVAKLAQ